MPDYSSQEYREIEALLAAQGSKIGDDKVNAKATALAKLMPGSPSVKPRRLPEGTEEDGKIAGFNQSTFKDEIGRDYTSETEYLTKSSVGGRPLGSGYCAGVCLDWLRRVLNTGWTMRSDELTYNYESIKRDIPGGGADVRGRQREAFQTVGRMGQAWYRTNNMSWTKPGDAGDSVPYRMPPSRWDTVAETLDEQPGLGGARFSGMELLYSKHLVYTSAGFWMASLVGGETKPCPILSGLAAQLSFSRAGESGHAVAVWRRRTLTDLPDSFYFFDPNFGVYSYSLHGLQCALQILFWYDDANTPFYESCASKDAQKVAYMAFAPAGWNSAEA